jgi:Zn-dependent M28 family amino/carboxypeptidase
VKKIITAAAFCGLVAACDAPQDNTENAAPAEQVNYEITTTALEGHIKTLSSDEFGGRAPSSPGEELTVAYLTREFQGAGLKPANGDSYTQEVPLVSIETQDAPEYFIKKGEETITLKYRDDMVVWTRREQDVTELHESEMVFVGYGINAPERSWNDYEGVDVKGKTVVMLINDPGFTTQDPELFNGNAMTYYGRWKYKFDEAAKQGASGAIIIHDTAPAAYPWATVDASWTGPQFDMVRADKGVSLSEAEAWITTEAADTLFAAAGLDRKTLEEAATKPGFKAVPMGLTASTYFKSGVSHVKSRNVAAMVEGSENPDEVFIYMAHWDHIGTDPTQEGDGIYNGALDNATGTGGLIELARAYAVGPQPKRTVMFLAVTAEEQGLLGSAYYAANPLFPLKDTVGGLNMDGLNYYGPTTDISVTGYGNSELDNFLATAAKAQDRVLSPNPNPERGGFYRSDHFELSKLGVPTIYPNAGGISREHGKAYVEAKVAEYLANRYHKPEDEYNAENWDLTGAVEDLQLFYATGRLIVDSNVWPAWSEGSEFKAIREKQRAK